MAMTMRENLLRIVDMPKEPGRDIICEDKQGNQVIISASKIVIDNDYTREKLAGSAAIYYDPRMQYLPEDYFKSSWVFKETELVIGKNHHKKNAQIVTFKVSNDGWIETDSESICVPDAAYHGKHITMLGFDYWRIRGSLWDGFQFSDDFDWKSRTIIVNNARDVVDAIDRYLERFPSHRFEEIGTACSWNWHGWWPISIRYWLTKIMFNRSEQIRDAIENKNADGLMDVVNYFRRIGYFGNRLKDKQVQESIQFLFDNGVPTDEPFKPWEMKVYDRLSYVSIPAMSIGDRRW